MASVTAEGELGADVDEVWKVVGDFGGFLEAVGMTPTIEGEGIGQTRTVTMGAAPLVERLEARDEATKTVKYSVVSGPLPVSNYLSTIQLSSAGEGRTKIEWSATFEPVGDEATAVSLLERVYEGGIGGLQRRFG
jgi:hypothetical protein